MHGETVFVEPKFRTAFGSAHRSIPDAMTVEYTSCLRGCGKLAPMSDPQRVGKGMNGHLPILRRLTGAKAGWPTGGNAHGHGPPVVVGERESRSHAKGATLERAPEPSADDRRQGRY